MTDGYRFGPFDLDPRAAELRRAGVQVPLQPQPASILALLVSRAGELVTREEIQTEIWPDRVVDYEQGLNYAIRQIRTALGDDAESPTYVETLSRRGYRFVAPVERLEGAEVTRSSRPLIGYGLVGLLLVAGGAVIVQEGIGRRVARAIAPDLVGTEPAGATTLPAHPAARETFLIARGLLDTRDREVLDRARDGFSAVLEAEPDFAPALTGLGEAFLRSGEPAAARMPLERAVRLAPDDAQAHNLLAQVLLFHAWDWERARRHLDQALRLQPGQASVHQVRAYWLAVNGRLEEARAAMETALRLDPLSSYVHADAGWIDYWAGHRDRAADRCGRTIELDPESRSGRTCLLFVRMAQGDWTAAREAARALMLSHGATAAETAVLDAAPVTAELEPYWSWEARRLESLPERSAHDAFLLALTYAQLDRGDDAFRELEEAWRGRTSWMLWLEVEPRLAPLRDDPRWAELVGRMGFPRSVSGGRG